MTKCSEIMHTEVKFVTPSLPVDKVAALMQAQDLESILVVESHADKKLLGMVAERDLVHRVIAEGRHPLTTRVSAVMRRNPLAARLKDSTQKALVVMLDNNLPSLPVLDDSLRLVGLIYSADITAAAEKKAG
jgi:signal-transduction protein with cAMP-binding, CBS, and nucleotidyltransferase domain